MRLSGTDGGFLRVSLPATVSKTEENWKMGAAQRTEQRQERMGRKPKSIIGLQTVYQRLQAPIQAYRKTVCMVT